MSKGKCKSSALEDDDDNDDEQQLTHTLADLVEESGPRHARRYTAGQFTDGLIGLVRRDNMSHPSAEPTACEECLEMAINRTPCPHGTFAPNGRPRPTLVWPCSSPPDALSEASTKGSGSTTPTPSSILMGAHGLPRPTSYSCQWGHPHSTREKPARCGARLGSSTLAASSNSRVLRASPADSMSAAPPTPFGGISTSGPTRDGSYAGTFTRAAAAAAAPTTTGYDWFGMRRRAALQAGAAPLPVAPPPAPTSPPYIAQIDPYDSSVDVWYVVTVGTRVGVFRDQFMATNATYRVSGQHYRHYVSYDDAVKAFRAAEAAGAVFQRNPKY